MDNFFPKAQVRVFALKEFIMIKKFKKGLVINSKATRREETSVSINSRKGLENAACRITGYGNSETCVTAVKLNQPWTSSETEKL